MGFLLGFFKTALLKKVIKMALKSAVKAIIVGSDTKIDDVIYSIIIKIKDDKPIDDEIEFLVNTYSPKFKKFLADRRR